MLMPRIFLPHIPQMLRDYYGMHTVEALRKLGDVNINPTEKVLEGEALIEAARGCDIIVADRQTPGPAKIFANSPDLVAFVRCAVDIRNIDVAAASKAGILVTQAGPGFVVAVAEMAIGFMIDLARTISACAEAYHHDKTRPIQTGRQLSGSTLGIIGYGAIGQHLARLGAMLGMTVLVTDPYKRIAELAIRQVEMHSLLQESDFVICLVVANEKTENLINAEAFAQMKRSAFFINLSRGNLVDEMALAQALDRKLIAGAALDVGRAQDQKPSLVLARRSDVIATPHIAALTPESVGYQTAETVQQVAEIIAGRVPNGAVNADSAYRLSRFREARAPR
jgi:D-3-phosphoglycerate dehydrogenase